MTATRRTRVVFAAHAFPRHQGDLTGGFLLRLAEALEREGVDVQAVAPAAPGLPARDRLRGVAVRRYRYAPRRAETLAYTGGMHLRAASPTGALALAGLLAAGALVLRASAAITTVSTWLRDEVAAFAPDRADRIRIAPMPVDEALFSPGDEPRTELLFVGRLDSQKGAEVALRALAGLRGPAAQLPLRLVGSGPLEPDLH